MAVITVSRGTWAGGEALARSLSERLGYRFLSREELFNSAASEYGIAIDDLAAVMDKPPSFWQQFDGARLRYKNYVRAALCQRALDGNLVYLGHAGHLLLSGISHVIRVRVIADMDYRVASVMEHQKLDRKAAAGYVKRMDAERERWARFLYGVDWNDPALYDVVLNLARMSVYAATETVLRMIELDEFRPTAQSAKAMQGLALGSRVWAALTRDARTSEADVEVTAEDGVVTITGAARSFSVIQVIPEVAGAIEGVKELRCEIAVASNRRH